jgi:hypothetical protein
MTMLHFNTYTNYPHLLERACCNRTPTPAILGQYQPPRLFVFFYRPGVDGGGG